MPPRMSTMVHRIERRTVSSASFYFFNRVLWRFASARHRLDLFGLLSWCVLPNTVKAYPIETRDLGPISDERSRQHKYHALPALDCASAGYGFVKLASSPVDAWWKMSPMHGLSQR